MKSPQQTATATGCLEGSLTLLRYIVKARDSSATALQGGLLGLFPEAGGFALVDARVGVVFLGVEAALVLDDVVDATCCVRKRERVFFLRFSSIFLPLFLLPLSLPQTLSLSPYLPQTRPRSPDRQRALPCRNRSAAARRATAASSPRRRPRCPRRRPWWQTPSSSRRASR